MAVLREVVAVRENTRLDVAGYPQNTVLLESQEGLLVTDFHLALDPVVEVDLELGPASLFVQLVHFLAQRLGVLVALLKMVRSQTD